MALPSSGAISLLNIATEFGGSTPHAISEYSPSIGIPAGNLVAFSNFYGASAASYLGAVTAYPATGSISMNPAGAGASAGNFLLFCTAFNNVGYVWSSIPSGNMITRNNQTNQLLALATTDSWNGSQVNVGVTETYPWGKQATSALVAYSGYVWAVSGAASFSPSTVVAGVTMPSAGKLIMATASSGSGTGVGMPNGAGWTTLAQDGGFAFDAAAPRVAVFEKDVGAGFTGNQSWFGEYQPYSAMLIGIVPG